jgi:hypothetical protein
MIGGGTIVMLGGRGGEWEMLVEELSHQHRGQTN